METSVEVTSAELSNLHVSDDTTRSSLQDLPDGLIHDHVVPALSYNGLVAVSGVNARLRHASAQEFKRRYQREHGTDILDDVAEGHDINWYKHQYMAAERSRCSNCRVPGKARRQHPLLTSHLLCKDCWSLPAFKMVTQENAIRMYGLTKTDLRRLRSIRDNPSGKGKVRKDRVHTWHLQSDVQATAEDLFGDNWQERAQFTEHD
eukprot:jgi/Chrzof1/165/Cz01g05220.t1